MLNVLLFIKFFGAKMNIDVKWLANIINFARFYDHDAVSELDIIFPSQLARDQFILDCSKSTSLPCPDQLLSARASIVTNYRLDNLPKSPIISSLIEAKHIDFKDKTKLIENINNIIDIINIKSLEKEDQIIIFHAAAIANNQDVMDYLLNIGININCRGFIEAQKFFEDNNCLFGGQTALHLIAELYNKNIINTEYALLVTKYLIDHGADKFIKNHCDKTAAECFPDIFDGVLDVAVTDAEYIPTPEAAGGAAAAFATGSYNSSTETPPFTDDSVAATASLSGRTSFDSDTESIDSDYLK